MPLAYGINKLQITCVIEDDKVSVDELQEKIEGFEDFVSSFLNSYRYKFSSSISFIGAKR